MKIELWSDYACPFCYIGEKRLEKALAEIDGGDKVEVEFKSFELDPYASREVVSSTLDRFAVKYHLSKEEAAERIEAISRMGRSEGIDFRYISTRYTNTFDSLRLTKYAQAKGKSEIITQLFDAYFTKNLELADHDVLKNIAGQCGLDSEEVSAVLASDRYAAEVRTDEQEAMERGIHGVPYFLINGKYTASGAQPTAMLKEAIEKILAEEASAASLEGMVCGANGCNFAQ
ncbi:DsbA family oxidoreductase [Mitsuokella multacida]|uniref:DsbA-like protein n=1 Tax=Mitsuokella multacida DSM 20544 TaxID=500635 RepID=C9KP43_9FIRM|nr:DsbA family oxidoreductase [Mitsuokella multacida]EEX67998.1 DsbA-like protein [Mitsuokella multacida DSM 20544]